jgi:circadian clock protein KaiC
MQGAERGLRTGNADLDRILGGGLQPGSTIVLAGPPGSGKTVLAQQISFTNSTPQTPALYYTTWSEPHSKLLRNLSAFKFFDPSAIGQRIEVLHLPSVLDGQGIGTAISELLRTSVEKQPSIVVIDSSKALHGLIEEGSLRRALYDLSSRLAHTGAVLLLVGEYTPSEIESEPEFAIADGIIQLANEPHGLNDRRWIRVLKMRGAATLPGQHTVAIDSHGFSAFPRLEMLVPKSVEPIDGRASFGEPGLDAITGGGLPRGDATLLLGPSGVGKTVLAEAFLAEGARRGEKGLYLSFQETRAELAAKAHALGWPEIPAAIAADQLMVVHVPPVDLDLNRVGIILRDALAHQKPTRVVVDSIAELDLAGAEQNRYLSYLWAAVRMIGGYGATGIFTQEIATLGPEGPSARLSFVFQNVIILRFVERQSEIQRAITAFKMRDTKHDLGLTRFEIGPQGVKALNKITGVTGLLGWSALRAED